MFEFKSWESYSIFSRKILHESRYIHDQESHDFLSTLWETSSKRIDEIKKDSLLYRAQLGCDYRSLDERNGVHVCNEEIPYSQKRMKPLLDRASEGRANPKGIPHLYLSNQKEIAMSEVRPWTGSKVTLAIFKIIRNLKVVNFSNQSERSSTICLNEPSPEDREKIVWDQINNAFSEPVLPCDHVADYVPTQIITELFKSKGIDGIVYKSNFGTGLNFVLFNLDDAEFERSGVFNTESLNPRFELASGFYDKK